MSRKRHEFWDTGPTLHIEFDSEEAAGHFKSWLCESGEQAYWQWMECREQEIGDEDDPITALEFDYWLPDGRITTKLGRIIKGDDE